MSCSASAPLGASAISGWNRSVFERPHVQPAIPPGERSPSWRSTPASAKRRRKRRVRRLQARRPPARHLGLHDRVAGRGRDHSLTRRPGGRAAPAPARLPRGRHHVQRGTHPAVPFPPSAPADSTILRATCTSPIGVRTTVAPQSEPVLTTRLVERLHTTDGDGRMDGTAPWAIHRSADPPIPPNTALTANASV